MNELYHHGILGQKWGERNGPPYPLDSDDHSAEEKRKNHFSKDSSKDSTSSKPKKGLTKGQKTAIKVGVGVVGTAIAAYGAYRLVKSGKIGKLIKKGKELVTGKDLEELKDTSKEYLHRTPLQESMLVNPHYFRGPEYQNNCVLSSMAYALRREGYKVQPGKSLLGYTNEETLKMFENIPKGDALQVKDWGVPLEKLQFSPLDLKLSKGQARVISKAYKARGEKVVRGIEDRIKAFYKPGDRGIFNIFTAFGGHSMAWEVKPNGEVVLLNPQLQLQFNKSPLFMNSGRSKDRDFLTTWFGTQRNAVKAGPIKKDLPSLIIKTNNVKISEFGKAHLTTEDGKQLGSPLLNTYATLSSTVMKPKTAAAVVGVSIASDVINYKNKKKKKEQAKQAQLEEKKKKEDKK